MKKAWETVSPSELGEIIQRLYLRLEQCDLHAASLVEGSRQQRTARVQSDRLRKRLEQACSALDRQMAEITGLGAPTLTDQTPRRRAGHARTPGNAKAALV
jgi:hypothetical protein